MFSSRQIERSTYEYVAVRLFCVDTHRDHDTLCTFRRQNGELLRQCFSQVLELAAHCKVLQVGQVTLAIDGTKILANASNHAAVSYNWTGFNEMWQSLHMPPPRVMEKSYVPPGMDPCWF